MKRTIFFLFFIFILACFFFHRNSYAACAPLTTTGMCPYRYYKCKDPTGTECCCEVKDECKASSCEARRIAPAIQPTPCDSNNDGVDDGIQTALGCIPTKDPTQFVAWLLKFAIGIGGGIAFLLIIFGAIKVLASAGNPESVKAGQEMITSALMGLLFIIFSLFLLQLIGVKILNIPGFGTP